jgi:hypothetical protein
LSFGLFFASKSGNEFEGQKKMKPNSGYAQKNFQYLAQVLHNQSRSRVGQGSDVNRKMYSCIGICLQFVWPVVSIGGWSGKEICHDARFCMKPNKIKLPLLYN